VIARAACLVLFASPAMGQAPSIDRSRAQDVAPPAAAATQDDLHPPLEIRVVSTLDLYFHVRTLAASKHADVDDALKPAVEIASGLTSDLGGALGFGVIDGLLGDCGGAQGLVDAFGRARETLELPSGMTIELRARAVRLAEALVKAEPFFHAKIWPAHEAEIRLAQDAIRAAFAAKESECVAFVAKHLALSVPEKPLRVRLVFELPPPGAVTQRDDEDRGVSFVGVHGHAADTQLFETILHEATHSLDLATPTGSVLADLRARLEKAGFTRRDREWRDVPHTLMFVQAGETIRRVVDPKHEHVGDEGYYAKVRTIAEIERPVWTDYLDGKLAREAAVEKIVAAVVAAKKPR